MPTPTAPAALSPPPATTGTAGIFHCCATDGSNVPRIPPVRLGGGVYWRDMGVVNLPGGQPTMRLTGGALERLKQITPPGMSPVIHLTLTDDLPLAQAIVIISAVPAGEAVQDGSSTPQT